MFSPTRLRASSRLWAPTGEIAPHPINQNYGAHSERLQPTRLPDDIRKADVRSFENAKSRRPKFVVSLICHSKSLPYNSLTESCFRALRPEWRASTSGASEGPHEKRPTDSSALGAVLCGMPHPHVVLVCSAFQYCRPFFCPRGKLNPNLFKAAGTTGVRRPSFFST